MGPYASLLGLLVATAASADFVQLGCKLRDGSGAVLEPNYMASSVNDEGDRGISAGSDAFFYDLSLDETGVGIRLKDLEQRAGVAVRQAHLQPGEPILVELVNEKRTLQLECVRH
jgi:hypothetical protein